MGYQSVQVGSTDEPSPKASVQVILRIKRALSWSFHRRCPHMVGRCRGCLTPVGSINAVWRPNPTTGLDSKSAIRAVSALVANDAVAQSCSTIPPCPLRVLRLAPFVTRRSHAQQSFVVGPSAADCPPWLLGLLFPHRR